MVSAIPADEPGYAFGDRCCRPEVHLAHQIIDIGIGCRHVTGLHGQQLAFGLFADGVHPFLERRNVFLLERIVAEAGNRRIEIQFQYLSQ